MNYGGPQLYQKETPTQVFTCKTCKIFKNTFFEAYLRTAAFSPNTTIFRCFKNLAKKSSLYFRGIIKEHERPSDLTFLTLEIRDHFQILILILSEFKGIN